MVDTKDNSNESPKPTFRYDKDGETIDIDVNESFSDEGKIQFKRLLDYQVQLTKLNEALVNSVVHGNAERKTKHVLITYALCGGEFRIRIQDQGPGFSPGDIADPLDEGNLLQPHGRGVFMMRKFMDHVEFNNAGNCVTMIKRLRTP